MKPFDLEVWYGERVAVLGSNGSGKSHFLRLLAAGGSDPDKEHQPVGDVVARRSRTPASRGSARGCGPAGSPRPTSTRPCSGARCSRSCTAATSTGPASRARRPLGRSTATSWRAPREQTFESLSGGQQARFQILLLELSGADPAAARRADRQPRPATPPRRSRRASTRFEGTVVAVTHDRWFAREFDRYLVFGADGRVYESTEPVWDEGRVARAR